MNRQTITRRFEIDAGHRLVNHESKCRNIHGHRYAFEVTVRLRAGALDSVGRVIDFGVVKEKVGGWLDLAWDHGFIADKDDVVARAFMLETGMKCCIIDTPPTIENLVRLVFNATNTLLEPDGIECVQVRGYETPMCFADYTIADAKDANPVAITSEVQGADPRSFKTDFDDCG